MNRPLRVLAIGHSYVVAGNRAIIREVARDPGFQVTVAAPSFFHGDLRPVSLEPEPPGSPLRLVGLGARWTRFVHVFRYDDDALRRLVAEGGFEVVHAWEEPYVYAGQQIARALRGHPARFCFRTAQSLVKRYAPPFGHFERVTRARAQGWIAGGELVRGAMLRRGYPAERGRVITLAVDTAAFRPSPAAERAAVLRELGLAAPMLGFVGRLTAAKGLDVLMRALELVPPGTPWSLLLLGSGSYDERVRRWARAHGWSDRVRIHLARHEEVPRYLGAMDLMVAPSQTTRGWKEQFGRMLIEAFAAGVPVVASDSGEIPFVVGDAGRIVPEGDPAAWARAITELLADAAVRAELARRGAERVGRYSVPAVAAEFREFYRWLAEQR